MQLPLHCSVQYLEDFLSAEDAQELYTTLIEDYQLDQARLIIEAGGQMMETDSFKILFSTPELIQANSHPEHIHGKVYPWTGPMAQLKHRIEALCHKEFQLAMCLYYPNGHYFAPYHFDQQTSGRETIIPSVSLGEVRTFCFKYNQTGDVYDIDLANGSVLLMGKNCQTHYTHSLPKKPECVNPRINITFRETDFK